jgi:hypothetical protein
MKSLLLSALLVAVLVVLVVRPWTRGTPTASEPTPGFLSQCTPVAAARPRPEAFCRCLWERGVRRPAEILSTPEGRAAAVACEPRGR